jgi:hypothetical protein
MAFAATLIRNLGCLSLIGPATFEGKRAHKEHRRQKVIEEKNSSANGVTVESLAPNTQPFSQLSPDLAKLNVVIHSLEQWYASDFTRRVTGLKQLLHEEILLELSAQFTAEFDSRLEDIRIQYQESLSAQSAQFEKDRQLLLDEIEELRKRVPGNDVLKEIMLTEAAIASIAQKVNQESGGTLADLICKQAEQLEAEGYLRGLKFGVEPTNRG